MTAAEGGQYSLFKQRRICVGLKEYVLPFSLLSKLCLVDYLFPDRIIDACAVEWWLLVYGKWCTDHWQSVPHLQQKGNEQARFRTSCLLGAWYDVAERNPPQNLPEIHMYSYTRLGHLLKSCPGFTSFCSTVHFGRITNEGAVFMTASCELDIFTTSCKLFTRKQGNVLYSWTNKERIATRFLPYWTNTELHLWKHRISAH